MNNQKAINTIFLQYIPKEFKEYTINGLFIA